ncbi:LipA and NB-ARC domain protein [Beauveria brongniartii RCEF 3172]|uniref:Riboflavin kinase n=1 Tax=Beauveria brongniartii RCEF 3172 TaxID=1081107 RepID=A0A167GKV3_9HYPO|nr:LipA and NB-ARC domain protein [Beauveria brongniartii RCEF 3172]
MNSPYGMYNIPRRPVTSAASPVDPPPPYSCLPEPPPLPPRLRSSKSATGLHEPPNFQQRNPHQQQRFLQPERPPPYPLSKDKQSATLPPGFVFDHAPSSSSSPSPLLPGNDALRRAKSSGDLRRPQTSHNAEPVAAETAAAWSWKKALDEAQYLAGGLIGSPAESNRHCSIIRHSSALVWYRGPTTTVTVTVLADEPLPATRTLWLQQKGFSGGLGMSLKAMVGTTSDWLDVTPTTRAEAAHLAVNEERGVQRDLRRFINKATGRTTRHLPRETHIVRIPAAAQDGYFRIVLCPTTDGKKVLGSSPVFRLASTSADVSVMRGASLGSMPLEVGAKVASAVASGYVAAATGAAAGVARMGAGKVAGKVTSVAAKKVAKKAYRGYETSGVGDAVKASWATSTAARYERAVSSAMMEPTVGIIGSEQGPEAPFPIKCTGRVVQGSGYTLARYGFPTANLVDVPKELTMRLTGSFASWVRVISGRMKGEDEDDLAWCEAITIIGPAENAAPSVVSKNRVAVHILQDLEDADLRGASLQVLLMGFLRPPSGTTADDDDDDDDDVDAALQRHADDLLTTLATLARDRWQPRLTVEGMRRARGSDRTWGERLDGVTGTVAARMDRVPVHRAGIRSEAGALRDASFGKGGLWIQR